jgi:hypothetical protein
MFEVLYCRTKILIDFRPPVPCRRVFPPAAVTVAVSDPGSRRGIVAYLVGMTAISAASIAVLYGLFVRGFPQFLSEFPDDPSGTVRSDPATPALALASIVLVLLLVALVVVFGARYGPDPVEEEASTDESNTERGPPDGTGAERASTETAGATGRVSEK